MVVLLCFLPNITYSECINSVKLKGLRQTSMVVVVCLKTLIALY